MVVVTTTDARARNLARLVAESGSPAVTTTLAELTSAVDPPVWDANNRRRSTLVEASLDFADVGRPPAPQADGYPQHRSPAAR
jgi:hypothetical protein